MQLLKNKRYIAYASFALAAVFGYLETFRVELTNDTNYYMHCAWRLWKYGPARLYSLCFDENFPYHTVLYTPLAALAGSYHIEPSIVLHTVCCLCCALCLVVLSRVMKVHDIDEDDRYLWLAIVAFALLVVPSIYGVFADREHFLFIFGLPWMYQMLLRLKPSASTCVMAAFGFLMKPHDYALFGLMTLFGGPPEWSPLQRLFSVSALIMYAAGAIYVALIWIFFPDFIYQVLPLSIVVYPTKYYSSGYKFNFSLKYIIIGGATVLAFARPWDVKRAWLAFILGCTVVLFLNAGWDYTFYLVAVPMTLSLVLPFLNQYGGVLPAQKTMVRTVVYILIGVLGMGLHSIASEMGTIRPTHFRNHNTVIPALRTALQQEAGDKIIVVSPNVWNSQVEPFASKPEAVFGYDNIWTYWWLGSHEDDPHYPKIRDLLTSNFLATLKNNPTAVIFADVSPRPVITPDGPLGFLMRDPQVREEMSHYTKEKTMDYCTDKEVFGCRFDVYKRQTP